MLRPHANPARILGLLGARAKYPVNMAKSLYGFSCGHRPNGLFLQCLPSKKPILYPSTKTDAQQSTTMTQTVNNDPFILAGTSYQSRLLVGTGKYKDFDETRLAIEASGAEIVTVAIRRTNIGQNANEPNLLDYLPPSKYTLLPNTAGCYTADDAVRTLRLARELLDGHKLVKLEVLGDSGNLFPNMPETLKAAKTLVDEGFDVMVYCADDPIQARMLEDIGCVAIMPLASLIGSGMGIINPWNLRLIIDQSKVPVLVDAGVGTASDAAIAMELGCDGVLMNTAIAGARQPVMMASAMNLAVQAGRQAYLAGRVPRKYYDADPSSPTEGLIHSRT